MKRIRIVTMALNNHSLGLNNPSVGEGYTPAYQISAIPFVTSSLDTFSGTLEISFPMIARFFEIKNTGENEMAFGFSQNGVLGSNKFILKKDETYSGEIRTTKIFLSGSSGGTKFSLIAGLTNISARFGSDMSGSLGVG